MLLVFLCTPFPITLVFRVRDGPFHSHQAVRANVLEIGMWSSYHTFTDYKPSIPWCQT